jgi:hypothetical protein
VKEEGSEVQMLTIKAATPESGRSLYDALQQFHPELGQTESGDYYVSVGLGGDRRVLDVLDAISAYLADRAEGTVGSMNISLDGRAYTIHGQGTREEGDAI